MGYKKSGTMLATDQHLASEKRFASRIHNRTVS